MQRLNPKLLKEIVVFIFSNKILCPTIRPHWITIHSTAHAAIVSKTELGNLKIMFSFQPNADSCLCTCWHLMILKISHLYIFLVIYWWNIMILLYDSSHVLCQCVNEPIDCNYKPCVLCFRCPVHHCPPGLLLWKLAGCRQDGERWRGHLYLGWVATVHWQTSAGGRVSVTGAHPKFLGTCMWGVCGCHRCTCRCRLHHLHASHVTSPPTQQVSANLGEVPLDYIHTFSLMTYHGFCNILCCYFSSVKPVRCYVLVQT